MMPPHVKEQVLKRIQAAPSPTRQAAVNRTRALGAAGLAVTAIVWTMMGGVGGLPPGLLMATSLVWLPAAILLTWMSLYRGRSMVGRPTAIRAALALGACPLVASAVLVAAGVVATGAPLAQASWRANALCVALGIVFAAGPLASWMWMQRGRELLAPAWSGALLGAAAGAWGGLFIHWHCSIGDTLHVVVGHVAPIGAVTLMGALLGWFVLPLRARRADLARRSARKS